MKTSANDRFILALVLLFAPSAVLAQGAGYWHTSGNRILDAENQQVRIAGINWYGFETTDAVAHGLTSADYKAILGNIQSLGYNTVRIPFSNQMVESPTPSAQLNITYWHNFGPINTDLQGLNSLQVLDKIVAYAQTIGLKIILDNHRSEAGNSAEANGLWYTPAYPESAWIADWTALAARYAGNTAVIGFDLRNEPHNATSGGACWDCGGPNDWHLAAQRVGNAVLGVNPNLLIFVEGTDTYNNDSYWWGGNLEGVANSPVTLAFPNQLVYSAHDYGPHEYAQSWFSNASAASLAAVWSQHWAYIDQQGIAPVWLGEFGSTNATTDLQDTASGSQGLWFQSLVTFLHNDPTLNWTYWAMNGEDAYSLLDANYDPTPVSATKQSMLAANQFPLAAVPVSPPSAATNLSATAISTSQINLSWSASQIAGTGGNVTYTINFGTSAGSVKTILASGLLATAFPATGLSPATTYYFTVTAVSSSGSSVPTAPVSATTQSLPAPTAPSNLVASASSPTQINLSWSASQAASSVGNVTYSVYTGTSAANVSTLAASGLTSPTFSATGLTSPTFSATGLAEGTTYYFAVKAVANGVSSASSSIASATTQTAAPTPPIGVAATAVSATEIDLAWSAVSNSAATYNVYSGNLSGATNTLVASGISGTAYAVTGLSASTTYYFTIRSVSAGGTSAPSSQVSATTQPATVSAPVTPPTTPTTPANPQPTAPNAPANLSASAASTTQVNLSWSPSTAANSTSAITYTIYTGGSAGSVSIVLASNVAGTSFTVSALTPGSTTYYVVTATNSAGTSPASNVAAATTRSAVPSAPTNLTATAASDTAINLSWTASSGSGITYKVYSASGSVVASGITTASYQVSGLTASTAYTFTVKAVSAAGTSPASNAATSTTQAPASGSCHVAYQTYTDWGIGFTTGLSITNSGSQPLTSWTLTFSYSGNQQIYEVWSSNYSQSGQNVTLTNAAWNGTIAAGATISGPGFNASYTGANQTPTVFYLNGQRCN